MKPLKRFTQCGSLTMLFAVFIVLFGVSSTALTTFGKTNPNPPPATQGPIAKGRECSTHIECSTLQSTSCVKDPNDSKLRCLCGDNIAPINGLCSPNTAKGLHHMCEKTSDCDEYLVCGNKTKNTLSGLTISKATSPNKKSLECLCDEGNGYIEDVEDDTCNDGIVHAVNTYLMSIVPTIALLLYPTFYMSKIQH